MHAQFMHSSSSATQLRVRQHTPVWTITLLAHVMLVTAAALTSKKHCKLCSQLSSPAGVRQRHHATGDESLT
jgi:type VI protein secretion system component VasF